MHRFRPALQGLAAAALTIAVAAILPAAARLDLLALLLALTAGIYAGFGFVDGRAREKAVETAGALAFTGAALVGAQGLPVVLAGAWVAHVAWDLAHHPRALATRIAEWVPPFCLVYDLLVGAAILAWWWPF